jgi:hypothetical protein
MIQILQDLSTAALIFVLLGVALEVGFRAGKYARKGADSKTTGQIGAIQGALLGLLGLLLAFSFSAAGSRFLERQDLVVTEANAIGTAYLRADLLDEPHRSELRAALKEYTQYRISLSDKLRGGLDPAAAAEIERQQARMWKAAAAGAAAKPAMTLAVVAPVNDVIDLHSTRMAARLKRLPPLVLGLLLLSSMVAIADIGYGSGVTGRRRIALTLPLALLIGASLWLTIDLDQPRAGLLRISDAPLKAIKFD